MSYGSAPGGPTVAIDGASINEAANRWQEDVEKQGGKTSAMRNALEVMGICAHI